MKHEIIYIQIIAILIQQFDKILFKYENYVSELANM